MEPKATSLDHIRKDFEDKKELPKKQIAYTMSEIMKKQSDEIRGKLMEYRVVSNRINTKYNYSELPNHCDILLFGPSGSGKSSLIRTFYQALYSTRILHKDIEKSIIVKGEKHNEGTTLYSGVTLKPEERKVQITPIGKMEYTTSAIMVHDTRGQIWMDSRELAQLDLIIQGKVKNMSYVEQRSYRYAYLLWEFWKKDAQLFPTTITTESGNLYTKPHCMAFVFDGSMEHIPNGPEETKFYRDVIQMARSKQYVYPQIVLTRIDKVEQELVKTYGKMEEHEKDQRLREIIDIKIESVVLALGVSRSSVHFIENYHSGIKGTNLHVEFKALRLLHECVQQADSYLQSQLREKSSCVIQ